MSQTKFLLEACESVRVISEKKEADGNHLRVLVKWQQADRINGNNRLYPRSLLQREISKISERIARQEVWGSPGHPDDGIGNPDDISHIWEKVWMTDKGECLGEVEVLPTTRGKNLQVTLKRGKIGMSSRGKGTLIPESRNGVTYDRVADDFNLISPGDFVLGQSVQDAGNIKVLENQPDDEAEKNLAEMIRDIESASNLNGHGELTDDEMRISGAKHRLGEPADIKLSNDEFRISGAKGKGKR